ncbi:MAG TPA: IS5/IS1182 family transposase, partial [Deltaproteobacteria bacterium]|nr:IS5/IS1182 family transposase [Deltaproteobacteria bacterium]
MHRAARNRPLNSTQRIINRFISSLRYRVEQSI